MRMFTQAGRLAIVVLLISAAFSTPASAQRIEAEAFAGEPLGVGRIVVDLPQPLLPEPLGVEGLGVSEKNGRVLYPALHNPALAALMKEIVGAGTPFTTGGPVREEVGGILRDLFNRPPRTTIYFLFRGNEPLEVTLQARQAYPLVIQPRRGPVMHRRLLAAWWKQYAAPPRLLEQKPDYPPLVENYLTTTLARRFDLKLPREKQTTSAYTQFEQEVGALMRTEAVRLALEQDRLLGLTNLAQPADRPLPAALEPPPLAVPEPAADVKLEPIALRVPAECFYVRFGTYDNFLWMQDTLDKWNGDLQNLVAMRGIDYGRAERMQRQLVLSKTRLGGVLISDVAILGTDMFFAEGAAYGFLFEARNSALLAAALNSDRAARVKDGGVTEQKVQIEGQDVSLLFSPDGSVRSYYVISGDYHFVTSSRALAARFLQTAAKGDGSLGTAKEFRYARTLLPLARGDTIFVYLSDAFFRNITSPRYRLEIIRRLEAVCDIELVQLAKLNAATEGKPGGTIEQLIAGGMLPPDFGPRPDGSRAVLAGGEVTDQLRGPRGWFLPIPDAPVQRITAAEEASYKRFAEFYKEHWGRIDPMLAAIKRTGQPNNREQVVLDVHMTPLDQKHVQFFQQWVGAPDKKRLAAVPGNLAAFDAILRNQRLFGGLHDVIPPVEIGDGRLLPWLQLRNSVIGYLGTVGNVGRLAALEAMIAGPVDANGYARGPLGLWRRQFNGMTVYSFQPEVLAAVTPQLHFEEALRPAQLWLHVGDISQARMTPFLNNLAYSRTRQTALGNLRLMHGLNQQLHVPTADCKEAAEFLLAAKLLCPLGGKFVLRETPNEVPQWTTTMIEQAGPARGLISQAPPGYLASPLSWLRNLDLDAMLSENQLSAHADVLMQMPEKK